MTITNRHQQIQPEGCGSYVSTLVKYVFNYLWEYGKMAASQACKSHYAARVQHQAREDAGDSGLHPFPE